MTWWAFANVESRWIGAMAVVDYPFQILFIITKVNTFIRYFFYLTLFRPVAAANTRYMGVSLARMLDAINQQMMMITNNLENKLRKVL